MQPFSNDIDRELRKESKIDALEMKNLENAMSDIMKTLNGRRVIHYILSQAGMFSDGFFPGKSDVTVYNSGRRSVGLALVNICGRVDEKYLTKLLLGKGE